MMGLPALRRLISFLPQYLSAVANNPGYTDPFAEADEDTGETKQSQNYIHIRIQRKFAFATCDQTSS